MSERNKPRNRLSLSKGKKKGNQSDKSSTSVTTPITSFFKNTPPPDVACPLCGQLVPRFSINHHIDLQCKNFQRADDAAPAGNDSLVPRKELSPKVNGVKSPARDLSSQSEENKETKTSPYFKKHRTRQMTREKSNSSVVRQIDLGALSSKMCRIREHGESRKIPDTDGCNSELSGSQKENLCDGLDDSEVCSKTTDLTSRVSHSEMNCISITSPQCLANEHIMAVKKSAEVTINPVFSPGPSSSSKRKAELPGTSMDKMPVSSKKPKREGISIESNMLISSQEQTEISDTSNKQKEPYTASGLRNKQQKVHEKVDKSLDGAETSEHSAFEPSKDSESNSSRLPYYLRNFRTVLKAVLENEDDRKLFNQEDLSSIQAFEKLSVMGQKLYVRLFQRKLKWLQVNRLDYEEISKDLGPVAQELVDCGFLEKESDLQDLGEALDLLLAPDLKSIAKTFHLSSSVTQKQQLVEGLRRLSRQKSLFSLAAGQNNIGAVILKRAKQLAGSCVRLRRGPRAVFSRVLLLFSLTDGVEEEEMGSGGQGQLYTILLVNSGRMAFPDYTMQRSASLFQDRDDLIRYEAAMRALQEVITAMQGGQWEEASDLYKAAKNTWQELGNTLDLSHQEQLPVFLRCFTTGWAYTRILSRGVEILQRQRCYKEAVEELRSLLAQTVYCPDSRGRWWDRLALNLQQHLKRPEQAICAIRDGLADPLVRTGHQLSLHQRAVRMKESPSMKKHVVKLKELPTINVTDVPHVTIRGQLFPHEGGTGKNVFLMPADQEGEHSNATIMCSVEELSLAHYCRQGFDQGIHGEGSTFSTLFGLLLWDVIFMEGIPDVFRNPYQTCPLDLFTDCFYGNRRDSIETRVQLLREASVEVLHSMMEDVWTCHMGKACSLVNWECFASLQQAQSLVSCMGGAFLAGMITRMAKDYRHCRAGLPDLVVWSTSANSYKLVEVKGPSDRLSQKQQIWLDELQKLGADVEVCHVTAIGAKGFAVEGK
ncbi:fanconi-associated nuclease 1 [Gadus morhua]|uniref:Fanconi-associated nuclease n=1 Tax=Gadus morhua TaxID=8049 RepID=A0A8C5B220_GADMO|nr:fanconi-associated nuclease 1 [Gadus morhua]